MMEIDETIEFERSGLSELFKADEGAIEQWQELVASYKGALREMETRFAVLNDQFAVRNGESPIETIKARLKKPASIHEKLLREGVPVTVASIQENIEDVAGIRVICAFMNDIYRLADCLKAQDDLEVVQVKDYIAHPKPNGYRSLHVILRVPIFLRQGKRMVRVEVQFRTIAMDFWASLEHKIRYKKNIPDDVVKKLEMDLKSTAELANLLDERMQDIRNDMRKPFDWY